MIFKKNNNYLYFKICNGRNMIAKIISTWTYKRNKLYQQKSGLLIKIQTQ